MGGRAGGCRPGRCAPAKARARSGAGAGGRLAGRRDRDRQARNGAGRELAGGPGRTGRAAGCQAGHLPWCQASLDPRASARPSTASARPARWRTERRRRRCRSGAYRPADLRSSRSRWRANSSITYGCMVHRVISGSRGLAVRGSAGHRRVARIRGPETVMARPVICWRGFPARASALARTMSGSRGPGGRASRQARSRRALGLSARICFTLVSSVRHRVRVAADAEPATGGVWLCGGR
jgi:hypothetical protein